MTRFWILRDVVVPLVITRLFLLAVGYGSFAALPDQRQPGTEGPGSLPAVNLFSHFDGGWYLQIAREGYTFYPDRQSSVAFAPLYPLLMRAGGFVLGGSVDAYLIAGLVLSNAFLLLGLVYLGLLIRQECSPDVARRAVLYVLVFPTSFYLSAVYPMSLMLLLATASMFYARRSQWTLAGVLCGGAALARPDGVLLAIAIAVEFLDQRRFRVRAVDRNAFWLLLAPACTLGWLAYQHYAFGDALAFMHAQTHWAPSPFVTVLFSFRAPLILGLTGLFVVLTILSWRTLRPSYAAYATVYLLLMLSANRYWSILRFLLILFPAFIVLAQLVRRRGVHLVVVVLFAVLSALLMMRFALNHWVA